MITRTLLAAATAVALGAVGAAAQSGGPGELGVLNDMSSLYADIGDKGSDEAAKMAAEDTGNVLGQPVQVIFADHQNKPDVVTAIARQWDLPAGAAVLTAVLNSAAPPAAR